MALQHLSRDADAMLSYASGLVEDAKNAQLLQGLVTAASQSAIQGEFAAAVVTFRFLNVDPYTSKHLLFIQV